jgi:hypothetical protein
MAPSTVQQTINDWIALTAMEHQMRTNVDIHASLKQSVGRVLISIGTRTGDVMPTLNLVSHDQARHICDWLSVAHERNEAWLSRVDAKGRPLKLMKFGSIEQIVAEADKAMAKRSGDPIAAETTDGTKAVYDAGDGWTVVRLLTSTALDIEGQQMGHCVGQGAYDCGLSTNFIGIYSLRDPSGKSHVTIEIDHTMDKVEQIKGKQNKPPKAEYMRRLLGWKRLQGASIAGTELPPNFGVDKKRGIIEFSSLQAGDVFLGNIGINLDKDVDDYVLPIPEGITVRGDVVICGLRAAVLVADPNGNRMRYPSVTIPHGVTIDGSLRVDHVKLDNFSVKATRFTVRSSTIGKLGEIQCPVSQFSSSEFLEAALDQTSFDGSVEMQACRGVVFFKSTRIEASVSLAGCRIVRGQTDNPMHLADGFSVRRGLNIFNSLVTFGDKCVVDGELKISNSTVLDMPSTLKVSGNFTIDRSQIDRWPEIMSVGGQVNEQTVRMHGESSPAMHCSLDHGAMPPGM